MGRRTLLLITSILIAAVGTALIGLYVRGADDRAVGDNELRNVLVANGDIASNTTMGQPNLRTEQRRALELPKDALDPSTALVGKHAKSEILDGQVLQGQMFGDDTAGAVTGGIGAGKLGIMIELGDPQRAAGLLKVGSYIDVFSIADKKVDPTPVLTAVKVIQIGNLNVDPPATSANGTADGSTTDNVPTTLVGLALEQSQVVEVKNAEAQGTLFFAVLPGAAK